MDQSPVSVAPSDIAERVVVRVDSASARWIGALALLGSASWLIVPFAADHHHGQADTRLAWSVSIVIAVAFIARGIFLGRPVTVAHAGAAGMVLTVDLAAYLLAYRGIAGVLTAGAGMTLMWPTRARAQPDALPHVWALVKATHNDPLAPFAMQSLKSYHFAADHTAAIAYRTRGGFAVVSGDPIGDDTRFTDLFAEFATMCRHRGWLILVLGASAHRLKLWSDIPTLHRSLTPVPVGRDVLIDVATFHTTGRKYRNLRQAVQRTKNRGISTELIDEHDLDDTLRTELTEILHASPRGSNTERGFSMVLDHTLEGAYPGIKLIIARDGTGRVQAFHRYATAGGLVTLDLPWRRVGAPNGIDERLSIDMINWAKTHDMPKLSLAFAPFPELFADIDRTRFHHLVYTLIHFGDPLIALESLYRYVRKFHSFGDLRYVLLFLGHLLPALVVLLSLEFIPRRRHERRTSQRYGRAA